MFYRIPLFNYYKPKSLDEALELIDKLEDAKVIAGGTDLINDMRIRRYKPKHLIDISSIKELNYIIDEGSVVRIGALTRLQELVESSTIKTKLPLLHNAVYNMASWQIRNMATIGGNLCNASPAADTAPPLLVHEAKLKLTSINGERIVDITEFFKGPRNTVLKKNELLTEIIVPILDSYGFSYIKFGRRSAFTLSVVAIATAVKVSNGVFEDVRIALNSVAPTPVRAKSVEEYLRGKNISRDVIDEAAKLVIKDISPISDVRASADYRRELSIVLTRDTLVNALKNLGYSFEEV
ncbi:xanthine dehydrogenase family protein subunit M [Desulfurococcaceae archaeon MEX13E-LK6-19]|nr:xanthine dehydrogenase family protein subunit M [Desulfurococcaceae archaeon MEX13E-LK6-19]